MNQLHTVILGLAYFCLSPLHPVAAERPNIVIIYTDDLGYGDLSCYGAEAIKTPNIDQLAETGLRFTKAYTTAATCTPSRFSLLTGHYPFRRKGTRVLPGDASMIIDATEATLPRMLRKAGYHTACIGKWHLGLGRRGQKINWNTTIKPGPNEVGFDYSFIIPATNDRVPTVYLRNHKVANLDPEDPLFVSYRKKVGSEPTVTEQPDAVKVKCKGHPNDQHSGTIHNGYGRIGYMSGGKSARWNDETMADDLRSEAEKFIDRHLEKQGGQPFFIYLSTADIHAPRISHPRFKGKSQLGDRGDMLLQLDDFVGQFMEHLKEKQLAENTLIIFSSDNGPILIDAYLDGSGEAARKVGFNPSSPWKGTKYSSWEGGSRVPLIVNWPGRVKPGVSKALLSQVDLFASLAGLVGGEMPEGKIDSQNHITALLGDSLKARQSLVTAGGSALRSANWKLVNQKLYNLDQDPTETQDLSAQNQKLFERLQQELTGERERYKLDPAN